MKKIVFTILIALVAMQASAFELFDNMTYYLIYLLNNIRKIPFRSAEAETCVLNKQNQSKTMRSKFNNQVMNANNDNFV